MKSIFIYLALLLGLSSCAVKFKLNGASVPDNLKSFTVQYFENRAPLINPNLSQTFTEALKDRITSESRLILEEKNADIDFSGTITGYSIRPMSIQADALSAETRLTVTVKVSYKNFKDPKENWETSFKAYEDYPSDQSITEIEADLVKLITDQITEDIFNKAFSDW